MVRNQQTPKYIHVGTVVMVEKLKMASCLGCVYLGLEQLERERKGEGEGEGEKKGEEKEREGKVRPSLSHQIRRNLGNLQTAMDGASYGPFVLEL